MIVKEHINFERGKDPKDAMGTGIYKSLESRGIRFYWGWGESRNGEKEEFIKNIGKMSAFIEKLVEAGFDISKMYISHARSVTVKVIQVIDSQHVIHQCATQEDADILIKACLSLSMVAHPTNYRTEIGEYSVDVYACPWLDNLIENRKKYKNV